MKCHRLYLIAGFENFSPDAVVTSQRSSLSLENEFTVAFQL